MKTIKEYLKHIENVECTVDKIGNFLKTKRGMLFVSKLHTAPLNELCKRYDVPGFVRFSRNSTINYNLIRSAINKAGIQLPKPTKKVALEAPEYVKTPLYMTSKELKAYNKVHSPRKMGFAALMHALEEHKMKKFEDKCPWLFRENIIKGDLFSDELTAQRNTQLFLYREYVRNFLSGAYCNTPKREYFYRLFLVKENKSEFAKNKFYEVEGDPMIVGYPFTMCTENTNIDILREILYSRTKTIKAKGGELPIELKLYNKYGKLVAQTKLE